MYALAVLKVFLYLKTTISVYKNKRLYYQYRVNDNSTKESISMLVYVNLTLTLFT